MVEGSALTWMSVFVDIFVRLQPYTTKITTLSWIGAGFLLWQNVIRVGKRYMQNAAYSQMIPPFPPSAFCLLDALYQLIANCLSSIDSSLISSCQSLDKKKEANRKRLAEMVVYTSYVYLLFFFLRGNLLKVQIFFSDLNYEAITETKAYPVSIWYIILQSEFSLSKL